jgi:REP-associated tyrosine transposase
MEVFRPNVYYHIYNRANGNENLFREEGNYFYFLRQWNKYISPVADSYAYCLMPNHFHFLIKVRNEKKLNDFLLGKLSDGTKSLADTGINKIISLQFSHLFNSYSQAYNRMFERKGSLFSPNFKRKAIDSKAYLANVIKYIHHNPVHHGITVGPEDWPHSSIHALLSIKPTALKRKEALEQFGGFNQFKNISNEPLAGLDKLEMEFT